MAWQQEVTVLVLVILGLKQPSVAGLRQNKKTSKRFVFDEALAFILGFFLIVLFPAPALVSKAYPLRGFNR